MFPNVSTLLMNVPNWITITLLYMCRVLPWWYRKKQNWNFKCQVRLNFRIHCMNFNCPGGFFCESICTKCFTFQQASEAFFSVIHKLVRVSICDMRQTFKRSLCWGREKSIKKVWWMSHDSNDTWHRTMERGMISAFFTRGWRRFTVRYCI